MLMVLILGPGIAFLSYRWSRIGGDSTEASIRLRGWWKTVEISPTNLARISKEESLVRDISHEHRFRRKYRYVLHDHRDEVIGTIPRTLEICPDWAQFLEHLGKVAAQSK